MSGIAACAFTQAPNSAGVWALSNGAAETVLGPLSDVTLQTKEGDWLKQILYYQEVARCGISTR